MPIVQGNLLRGLSASDRTDEEKRSIDEVMGYQQEPDTTIIDTLIQERHNSPDSVGTAVESQSDLPVLPEVVPSLERASALDKYNRQREEVYKPSLEKYLQQYGVGRAGSTNLAAKEKIDKIANDVSSYYKRYSNTDLLPLTDADYRQLAAEYDNHLELYGEDDANMWLDRQMKNKVGENQTFGSQLWDGVSHLIPAIEGGLIQGFGNIYGALFLSSEEENTNWLAGKLDVMMDNPITRYGRDLEHAGASHIQDALSVLGLMNETADERIARTKETATRYNPEGIGNDAIVTTDDQENYLFNSSTIPQALQSGGFTALSMLWGYGEAAIANKLFGAASKGVMALHNTGKVLKGLESTKKALTALKQVQNFTDRFVIPGSVGTLEGAVNGLNTKIETQTEGMNNLNDYYQNLVADEASYEYRQRMAEWENAPMMEIRRDDGSKTLVKPEMPNPAAIYREVWDKYADEYNESAAQVNYASTLAGITDFGVNSLINGIANTTLKAGLMAPSVQESMRNSKYIGEKSWLGKVLYGGPKYKVSADGTVTPTISKAQRVWNVLREPLGEGGEEFWQDVSSNAAQGAAENNISEFIRNKFEGDGDAAVGDQFASDLSAFFTAAGGSFNRQSLQSGILGAVSSTLGTVAGVRRGYSRSEDGKLRQNKWGRGLNERGEKESWWDVTKRLTPWRSGAVNAWNDTQDEMEKANAMSSYLTEWMKDPQNKAKWDGAVGTANWLNKMFSAAEGNDQFSFRKSQMGRFINDVFMLDKLKGTDFYDSIIGELQAVSEMDMNAESTKRLIDTMRKSTDEMADMSDQQIVERLQKNANKMLGLMSEVEAEGRKVDNTLGRVDEDTKQSLIYGKMMHDDFVSRRDQLKEEIDRLSGSIQNSRGSEGSGLTEDLQKLILKYGSLNKALKEREKLEETKKEAEEKVKALETIDKDKRSDKQNGELKQKKEEVKKAQAKLKEFDALTDKKGNVDSSVAQLVLNEQDIMHLDPVTRAMVLAKGAQRQYNALHQDRQKIEDLNLELNDIERQIADTESQIDNWTDGGGKAKKRHNKQVDTARKNLSELNKQRDAKLRQLDAVQGSLNAKPVYSSAQQEVIDNLVRQGSQRDSGFLDKVVDMGRLERGIRDYYNQYNAILTDPKAYQNYVKGIKFNAAVDKARRLAERVESIDDFQTYSKELDNLLVNASEFERQVIKQALVEDDAREKKEARRRNEEEGIPLPTEKSNYDRYVENQKNVMSLIAQMDKLNDLTPNDVSLLFDAMKYLSSQGVDVTDKQAVVQALSELNDQGEQGGKFREYVESVNAKRLPQQETVPVFTTIGRVVSQYVGLINGKVEEEVNQGNLNVEGTVAPANAEGTPQAASTVMNPEPTPTPTVTPSPFDLNSTPDSGHFVDGNGTVATGTQVEMTQGPQEDIPNTENEKLLSGVMPLSLARQILPLAENSLDYDKEQSEEKALAWQYFRDIFVNNEDAHYDTLDDFLEALSEQVSALEAESSNQESQDNVYHKAANILEKLSMTLNTKAKGNKGARQYAERTSPVHVTDGKGAFIATTDINHIANNYPDSWITRFIEQHGVREYLREHNVEGQPVYFLTSDEWARAAEEEMENYSTDDNLPVVVAVLVDTPSNVNTTTAIEIEGAWYQPIGLLPSGKRKMWEGAAYTNSIRDAANKNTGTYVVKVGGNPLVSQVIKGHVHAAHIDSQTDRSNTQENNNGFIEGILNTFDAATRSRLANLSRKELLESDEYKEKKKSLLRGFGWNDDRGQAQYAPYNLNGDSKGNPMFVMRLSPAETKDRDTQTKTLGEVCGEGSGDDVVNFNSRTKAAFGIIRPLFAPPVAFGNGTDKSAKVVTTVDEGDAEAERLTNALNGVNAKGKRYRKNDFNNYLFLTGERKLTVTFDEEAFDNGNGPSRYIVWLANEDPDVDDIMVGEIIAGGNVDSNISAAKEMLRNIMYDKDAGEVRNTFVWQLSHFDFSNVNSSNAGERASAEEEVSRIIDDGFLTFAGTSLVYDPIYLDIRNPLTSDGKPVYSAANGNVSSSSRTVGNPDNAQRPKPQNTTPVVEGSVQGRGNGTIQAETGIVVEGKPTAPVSPDNKDVPETEAQKKAKELIDTIKKRSSMLELSEDEKYYIEKGPNGEEIRYLRVTTIGSADESYAKGRDGDYGVWSVPSTTLGNTVDAIVRDFFDGSLKDSYPNITNEVLKEFVEKQLIPFKNNLDAAGITIVPNDIKAIGNITTTDSEGKERKINVAGTLDLFGYDRDGNFYIFDMKTSRTNNKPLSVKEQENKDKWSLQLSLYADLLEQTYGIKINPDNLRIVSFGIEYPSPKGDGKGGTSVIGPVYSDNDGQLVMGYKTKSEPFTALTPAMHTTVPEQLFHPGRRKINISWDKLTDAEKELAQLIETEAAVESLKEGETPAKPSSAEVEKPSGESFLYSFESSLGEIDDDVDWGEFAPSTAPEVGGASSYGMPGYDSLIDAAKEALKRMGITDAEAYAKLVSANAASREAIKKAIDCATS